jgi:hypothetical protein
MGIFFVGRLFLCRHKPITCSMHSGPKMPPGSNGFDSRRGPFSGPHRDPEWEQLGLFAVDFVGYWHAQDSI